MKTQFKQFAMIAAISCGCVTSAWSANLPFTLTPSLANPTLTTNTGTITADTFQGFDNATLTITNNGGVYTSVETGIFSIQSFTLNGTSLQGAQLAGLNSGAADSWGLYMTFSATTTGSTFLQTQQPLTSFNFSLLGDPNSNTVSRTLFNADGSIVAGTNSNDVLLATGQLVQGTATIAGPPFNLSLQVVDSFNVAASQLPTGATSFFTAPENFYVRIGASATAFAGGNLSTTCGPTGPADGASCTFTITGGAPTAGFAVPEPGTLALLGSSLLGFGVTRRRKSS